MATTETVNEKSLDALLDPQVKKTNNGPTFGKRHIQAIVLTLMMITGFTIRTILSVSIVAMTTPSANPNKDIPTYQWSDKNLVLASFLWGYFVPQYLAGYVSDRYGAKWFMVCTTSLTAIAGLLIPISAAMFGSKGVMVCRILQGLTQGFLFPCMASILGKWIPSNERSRIGSIVFSGAPLGIVTSMILTGYVCASPYGWPFAFYLCSGLAFIVVGIYAYVGCSDPSEHSTITEEEKLYIKTNLKIEDNRHELKVPFKQILTSPPFLSLCVTNLAFNYTHWTLITETAIYLDKIMHFDLKSSSLLSSLPYIFEIVLAIVVSFIADFLSTRNILSTTNIRKIMNNCGLIIPGIALYLLGNTGPSDRTLVIFLIILISGMPGTGKSGHIANHSDLAPNFSGIMMGIANGTSVLFSSMSPTLAQFVLTDDTNRDQWRILFYVALGFNVFAAVINTFFTSGEKQPWSQGTRKTKVAMDKPV
ncbi:unnamed protein product [Psylliodes chrysocephalus]|uniref:Putative inorganic phosphate cotransporter n=1 Tax=Psylliodes chrysocephalus TaxID=3402493 RepID=A0A9P0CL42_9CUCU|nr:unnamed protein product [Psylliodes chrysocephala]